MRAHIKSPKYACVASARLREEEVECVLLCGILGIPIGDPIGVFDFLGQEPRLILFYTLFVKPLSIFPGIFSWPR